MGVALLLNREQDDEVERPDEPVGAIEVRAAISRAVETRSADDCDRLATPRYLRQYERRGPSALAACQKGVFERNRGLLPSDVRIEVAEVGPADALALVTYRGGGLAGMTARLRLVRDAKDRWALDRVTGFESATPGQLIRALTAEVASGPVPFGPGGARCAEKELKGTPAGSLERLLLRGGPADLFAIVASCDRRAFVRALIGEIREAGTNIPPAREGCFERDLDGVRPGRLVAALVSIEESGEHSIGAGCSQEVPGASPGA